MSKTCVISYSFLRNTAYPALVLLMLCWMGFHNLAQAQADCPFYEQDTLLWMDGTAADLSDWTLEAPSDGGSWQVDAGDLGGLVNPGEGSWVYVTESSEDNIGHAELRTPLLEEAIMANDLILSFSMVLETYQGAGIAWVAVYDGIEWVKVMELGEDYYGEVEIQLGEFAGEPVQISFVFDDEGAWSWGMGIDNVLLRGRTATCGDGICEPGEDCYEDCPAVTTAPGWIPVGENLNGQEVRYTRFAKGDACDDCSEAISLGFEFECYNKRYASAFINANGNITFETANNEFTPEPFCQSGPNMLAPFFADVDLESGGEIWYYVDEASHYLIVTWIEVGYYGCESENCEQSNSFQVIMTDGTIGEIGGVVMPEQANVLFSYDKMEWTTGTGSGGNSGFWGSPATVGINQGDGKTCQDVGTFNRPGRAYYGNTQDLGCPPNEVDYLEGKSLILDGKTGEIIEPSYQLSLLGEQKDDQHVLLWRTERPDDWDYFTIEGGRDSLTAGEIAMIQAESQAQMPTGIFSFQPEAGGKSSWYRVTGISQSGQFYHSNWISMATTSVSQTFEFVGLGPNPMTGPLRARLQVAEPASLTWRITSMNGQVLTEGQWEAQAGLLEEEIPLPELPAGTYVFTVRGKDTMKYRYVVKL